MKRVLLLLTLMGAMLFACAGVVLAQATEDRSSGRYIVVLDEAELEENAEDSEDAADDDEAEHPGLDVKHVYKDALQGYSAEIPKDELKALKDDPRVKKVVPDRVDRAFNHTPLTRGVDRIEGDLSSTQAGNDSGAVNAGVAVIDTGIDLGHTDLNARHGTNAIVAPTGSDGKKICTTSTADSTSNDDNGHGTHVAGTIGAKDDGAGVVGVAPGATLYSVKVLNAQGSGFRSDIICGIDWVTANAESLNIKAVNMSLGGSGSDSPSLNTNSSPTDPRFCTNANNDPYHTAICKSVHGAGVTYVVAAGNSNTNFRSTVPAAYDEVLTVTAMADSNGSPNMGGHLGNPHRLRLERPRGYARRL